MRYNRLLTALVFLTLIVPALAIETNIVDLAVTGGSADQTVTITRSSTDSMILKAAELQFVDTDTGSTTPLDQLAGVTDHGALTGLADDDHSTYPTWARFADWLGINVETLSMSYKTTGSTLTKLMPIEADVAGHTTLGAHTTDTLLHYYRPGQVVIVSKSDTGRAGEFDSIDDAVNSITDSASDKRYVILVYPGTYGETVILDTDYISIIGVDRDSCRIDNGSLGALTLSASNPGEIANLTFMGEQGTPIVTDSSTGNHRFYNCRFWGDGTGRATAYKKTAAGSVWLTRTQWVEDGSAGQASYSIMSEGAGLKYFHIESAALDTSKSDHTFLYSSSGDSGGGIAYVRGFEVYDTIVQNPNANGLFYLDHAFIVNLYDANTATYGVVIHPDSTVGTINYANVQTEFWGSPASGLTTAPIALSGVKHNSDVDLVGIARLLIDGNVAIDADRNATFDWLTATSATIGYLNATTLVTSATVFAPLNTTAVNFTTSTEAQETDGTFSHISTTSPTLRFDSTIRLQSGDGQAVATGIDFRTSGVSGVADNLIDVSNHNLNATVNEDNIIYLDATQKMNVSGRLWWDYIVANSSLSAATYKALNSSNNTRVGAFAGRTIRLENSSNSALVEIDEATGNITTVGNFVLAQDKKITQVDGASNAPLIWMIPPVVGLQDTLTSISAGSMTTYSPGTLTWSPTAAPHHAHFYWNFPIPSRLYGATVVLDRITVYVDTASGHPYVDEFYLYESTTDGSVSAVATHTADFQTDHQVLDADYSMEIDNAGYLMSAFVQTDGAGSIYFFGFKVEAHLE